MSMVWPTLRSRMVKDTKEQNSTEQNVRDICTVYEGCTRLTLLSSKYKRLLFMECNYPRRLYSRWGGVGRSVTSVCLFVHALQGKRLDLAAPKLVNQSINQSSFISGRPIVHGRTLTSTDPEVKRSNPNQNPRIRVLTSAMGMGRDVE